MTVVAPAVCWPAARGAVGQETARDAYLGQPDPVDNNSQNPVGYPELPFLRRA
jgi:hypothetical protein